MTRGRPAAPADLHDRFDSWLMPGGAGDPPRDVALHAAFCAECRGKMAALDGLAAIDTGRASLPELSTAAAHRPIPWARLGTAAAAALILAAATWIGPGQLGVSLFGGAPPSESPAQQVLGGGFGAGGAVLTPSPDADVAASDAGSDAAGSGSPAPADGGQVPASTAPAVAPPAASQPASSAQPPPTRTTAATASARSSATARPSPPPATAQPTPTPIPTAVPTPTETPIPSTPAEAGAF